MLPSVKWRSQAGSGSLDFGLSRFKWEDGELVFYICALSRLVFHIFTVGLDGRFCF